MGRCRIQADDHFARADLGHYLCRHRAVRQGRWKYMDYPGGREELFDLAADVAETVNLRDAQPEIAAALQRQLNSWEAHVDPPLYNQREAAAAKRANRRM
jgi:arylsulfatase A-like enzyme